MKIGDVVTNANSQYPLACGCGIYDCAVVVQLEPLVLVSKEADMRWEATIQERDFVVLGKADQTTLKRCIKRL